MDCGKLYNEAYEAIKTNDLAYIFWEKPLDGFYPVARYMKDLFNQYKFNILIIYDSAESRLRIIDSLSNCGFIKHHIDRIQFVPYYADLDYISKPKDLIVAYNLNNMLTVDEIESIVALRNRDVGNPNKPKVLFVDYDNDIFIKATLAKTNLPMYTSCLRKPKKQETPRVILHPIELGIVIDQVYTYQSYVLRDDHSIKEVSYAEFKKLYLSTEFNTKINVTCSQAQKYDLISKEVETKRKDVTLYKVKWKIDEYKKALIKRKNFLAEVKNKEINDFINTLSDKKIALFVNNNDQAKYFNHDMCLDINTSKDIISDHVLKYNSNVNKDICLKTTIPDDLDLEKTEVIVFSGITGNEMNLFQEIHSQKDLICHVFYVKNTYEQIALFRQLTTFSSDFYCSIDD